MVRLRDVDCLRLDDFRNFEDVRLVRLTTLKPPSMTIKSSGRKLGTDGNTGMRGYGRLTLYLRLKLAVLLFGIFTSHGQNRDFLQIICSDKRRSFVLFQTF